MALWDILHQQPSVMLDTSVNVMPRCHHLTKHQMQIFVHKVSDSKLEIKIKA